MLEDITQKNIEQVRDANFAGLVAITIQIYLQRFWPIVILTALINLPVTLYYMLYAPTPELDDLVGLLQLRGIDMAIGLYSMLGLLAIAHIVELAIYGEQASANDAINHALTRWPSGMWVYFLSTITVLICSIFLLVPGIAVAGYLFFDLYAVSLRDESGFSALKYSRDLVQGRWWRTVFPILGFLVLATTPSMLIGMIAYSGGETSPVFDVFVFTLSDIIFSFAIVGFTILFLHLDFQLAKEDEKELDEEAQTAREEAMQDEAIKRYQEESLAAAFGFLKGQADTVDALKGFDALGRHAYNENKDVDALVQVYLEGIDFGKRRAEQSDTYEEERFILEQVKGLYYNLSANTWPGWNDEGITIQPGHLKVGRQAAENNLKMAVDLERGELPTSRAHWLLGAHLMAAGMFKDAEKSFTSAVSFARKAGDEGEALLSQGFAHLAHLLTLPDDVEVQNALTRTLTALAEQEHGEFFRKQIETAQSVFSQG